MHPVPQHVRRQQDIGHHNQPSARGHNLCHHSKVPFNDSHPSAADPLSRCQPTCSIGACRSVALAPMLHTGAHYSSIVFAELHHLSPFLKADCLGDLDAPPRQFEACPQLKNGAGTHASSPRLILRSVVLSSTTQSRSGLDIRHLLLDAPNQLVVGTNMKLRANILMLKFQSLRVSVSNRDYIRTPFFESNYHLYLPFPLF